LPPFSLLSTALTPPPIYTLSLHDALPISLPHAAWDFVASHMDVAQRHTRLAVHRREVADHPLDEPVRRLEYGVHDLVVVALLGGVHRAVVRIVEPVLRVRLHGLDRGARVTRHLELGDHLDVPRRRVAQDLDVVRAGKEAAAPGSVDGGARAECRRQMSV